ncbi:MULTISPECIES: DUF6702 family protein [unclassified Leeuwenhoekiella]|uniref:DUF6702 family protein n=1 Tax=unclassified Leeuwenhoekiella TaxID=2615029 RepID=UPI000C4883B1|nr:MULTISPECIES: DUF6702 family protein [unclassified Leeuwenhoekiella]MAW96589.1 peptidase E [Leeuwenhoekiella sp.]MBA81477.1 peptidase E [Leeuwenhoekiella sp.]|tara:strand:+ start:3380 stop:3886 length:507 start_codon:yes stop_codon:yes gene_type:complete
MNFRKILLLLAVILPLFAFTAHKYYFSVTQADYDAKSQSLKIVTRVFYDDLQKVFQERYDKSIRVDASYDQQKLDGYIKRYFDQKFIVTVNGKQRPINYLGHKDEIDYVVCFIEVEHIENLKSVSIENTLLMDLFPEQKNVVHLNTGSTKKSFLLTRENDKAVLKVSK